jgi:predicted nucleic acid-binding protein
MGVVGVLLVGKQTGKIGTLHPLLMQLQQQAFRLSRVLVDTALRAAGEPPASVGEG